MALLYEKGKPPFPLLAADFPQMNFTQMHERLRLELLRRIQRGTVSVSLLARQTGFGQAHLSNFLHSRRQLSLDAMDRILAAQQLQLGDLCLPSTHGTGPRLQAGKAAPSLSFLMRWHCLSRTFALPPFNPCSVCPRVFLSIRARASSPRRTWQRFVAVRIPSADALPMEPLVLPDAVALIDHHYNSLMTYRPNRPNLYAVRHESHLTLRYVDFSVQPAGLAPAQHRLPS